MMMMEANHKIVYRNCSWLSFQRWRLHFFLCSSEEIAYTRMWPMVQSDMHVESVGLHSIVHNYRCMRHMNTVRGTLWTVCCIGLCIVQYCIQSKACVRHTVMCVLTLCVVCIIWKEKKNNEIVKHRCRRSNANHSRATSPCIRINLHFCIIPLLNFVRVLRLGIWYFLLLYHSVCGTHASVSLNAHCDCDGVAVTTMAQAMTL